MGSLCEIGISRHWEIADADFACFGQKRKFFLRRSIKKRERSNLVTNHNAEVKEGLTMKRIADVTRLESKSETGKGGAVRAVITVFFLILLQQTLMKCLLSMIFIMIALSKSSSIPFGYQDSFDSNNSSDRSSSSYNTLNTPSTLPKDDNYSFLPDSLDISYTQLEINCEEYDPAKVNQTPFGYQNSFNSNNSSDRSSSSYNTLNTPSTLPKDDNYSFLPDSLDISYTQLEINCEEYDPAKVNQTPFGYQKFI